MKNWHLIAAGVVVAVGVGTFFLMKKMGRKIKSRVQSILA